MLMQSKSNEAYGNKYLKERKFLLDSFSSFVLTNINIDEVDDI